MKKFIFIVILMLFSFNVKAIPLPVNVTADSALLYNLNLDTIIYEKNASKTQILASLTKIMTAHVAIQNIEDIKQKVIITNNDVKDLIGFTCVGLAAGNRVTYEDLLYGTILYSGADTSQALAYHIAGSPEKFVQMMNDEAKRLSLANTHFADTYGGDDANVSTAVEIAALLKEALKNETFKKIFTTTQYKMSNGINVVNYTRSIATFHGLDDTLIKGNKSGYTPEAGLLLASTTTINENDYIVIVMKSNINSYLSTHVLDTFRILDYIQDKKFEERVLIKKGTLLQTAKVYNSTIDEYQIYLPNDITVKLEDKLFDNLQVEYHIVNKLEPNTKVGDNIGFIDIILDGEIIQTENIYLHDKIYELKTDDDKMKILIPIITLIVSFLSILIVMIKMLVKYLKKK